MKPDRIQEQLDVLRARLELELPPHAVLTVTSAAAGDGKSAVAFGLAEAMAKAGSPVLVIDANHQKPVLNGDPQIKPTSDGGYRVTRLSSGFDGLSLGDARVASEASLELVTRILSWARDRYRLVIVDTAPLPTSALAVLFASVADATLLALRSGRGASEADRATLAALQARNVHIFGVVTTTREVQKSFQLHSATWSETVRTAPAPIRVRSAGELDLPLIAEARKPASMASAS
jgi:succinoglycan biosynthesis transport protein ExoP